MSNRRKGAVMSAEQPIAPSASRLLRALGEHRFGVLLAFLIFSLAGPPVLFGFGFSGQWLDGLMSLLTLAAICSLCFEPRQRLNFFPRSAFRAPRSHCFADTSPTSS